MTISESDLNRAWEKLEQYALSESSEGPRTDISTLLKCRDRFETFTPVYLFWEMYRPSVLDPDGDRSPALRLPLQINDLVLQVLDDMYRHFRVACEPDDDDSDIREYFKTTPPFSFEEDELSFSRRLTDLLILIHVAAARAFALKGDSGHSEEMVKCLDEVERAWQRLRHAGYRGSVSPQWHISEFYEIFHSIDAVSALALAERSRVTRDQGSYANALNMLVTAHERYSNGATLVMDRSPAELWPLDNAEAVVRHPPVASSFKEFLTGMHVPVEYVLETFNMLKASSLDVDWTQIIHNCKHLADANYLCFPGESELIKRYNSIDEVKEHLLREPQGLLDANEVVFDWLSTPQEYLSEEEISWPGGFWPGDYSKISQYQMERYTIVDEESNRVTWHTFWQDAAGWASAQLSPSEYNRMRENDEKNAAERRLSNYFFMGTWPDLPERARERIVSADVMWNSHQRVSREAILNELQRAAEEMCYCYFFRAFREEDQDKKYGLRDYIRMCESDTFKKFATRAQLEDNDVSFLRRDLPSSCRQLIDARECCRTRSR